MAFDLATAKPLEEAPKGFDLASAKPVEVAAPQPKRILGGPEDRAVIGRQLGLTARAGIKGTSYLPGEIANIPAMLLNEGMDVYDQARAPKMSELVTGKQKGGRFADQTQFGDKLSDWLGLPKPGNENERISQDVASGMTGAGGMVKAGQVAAKSGNALVKRIGEVFSTAPGAQVVSGGTGPGAASVVREEGGGPVAQTVAGVGGSLVPSIPQVAAASVRGLVRGGETGRQRVADNIATFEDAGAGTPSVGQATESRGMRALESTMAKVPGGAGTIAKKADQEAAGLGANIENMASELTARTGAAPAGRQIKSGLGQFVEDFKGQSGKLYDALDKHIPKDSQVEVGNTKAALEKLNADIPGAPELSKWFKNAKIQGIEGALAKDAPATEAQPIISQILGPGGERLVSGSTAGKAAGIPYEALKKLRTLVGNEMADSGFASDVPRSKWKPLYAALSKDMAAAAQKAGPQAEAALVRANNFHRSGMQRLTDVLDPILAKGDPEDIFKAAISGTKEGASTISGVMKSLPVESRKVVAGTMLKRLGLATPGKQNELGETFSTETFLTNWNKVSPDAKRVLFGPLSPEMRSDLDQVAKVASNMREGSKVFANPSGSAAGVASGVQVAGTAGAAVMALLMGNPVGAGAAIGGSVGTSLGAYGTSRLMTSPGFVKWLAKSTRVPVEQLPSQLNTLFQDSLYMKGDERKDARAFIKEVRAARAQEASQ